MPFEDFRSLILAFATADGGQEIGKVVLVLTLERADQLAVEVEQGAAGDDTSGSFEDGSARLVRPEWAGLQAARLRDNRPVTEIEDANLRVGSLASVDVAQAPAVADYRASQTRHAQAPAANVERVHVVVSQLAVARVPHPVPVVMQLGTGQGTEGRRAEKEVVIDGGRHFVCARRADRGTAAVDDAPRELHFPQFALPHVFHGRSVGAAGAVLMPALTDATGLPRNLHHPPAFANVVAHRLFNINIFAGLHSPNGCQSVPMIRCCD